MFIASEIDSKNTYVPNLNDINESALRTYGEANVFFNMVDLYLKDLSKNINEKSSQEIYDISSAVASDLAKCCEMFLKSLYIFENNVAGNKIDDIWNTLKNSSFKVDKNGNPIYLLEKNGKKIFTYVKVNDEGKTIYIDDNNNIYSEGTQGKKIKMNGHQLDRLIDILSNESKMLLEMRMCTIPINNSVVYNKVSLYDVLKICGFIFPKKRMSQNDYANWVDKHKKTFEKARYSGQNISNVNLEFLYHLVTQIKSVAQYKICPISNQKFDIVVDKDILIKNGVPDIGKILSKLEKEISKSLGYKDINNSTFYNLIKYCNEDEIIYLLNLCGYITIYNDDYTNDIIKFFKMFSFSVDDIFNYSIFMKNEYGLKINNDMFILYADFIQVVNHYYFEIDKVLSK